MMYFIDTEFVEGRQDKKFLEIKYGESKPTIDLISIAIVNEKGESYYAISKDFNLKEAWDRYDIKEIRREVGFGYTAETIIEKVHWLRDNVLRPIYNELASFHIDNWWNRNFGMPNQDSRHLSFTYQNFKWLLKQYGKSNQQIAEEVKRFVYESEVEYKIDEPLNHYHPEEIDFYGYYSDYDWVVFCWLFGTMIKLPAGFPMYCKDLKQILDEKAYKIAKSIANKAGMVIDSYQIDNALEALKGADNYPKAEQEHNALSDAKFNLELYNYLQTI